MNIIERLDKKIRDTHELLTVKVRHSMRTDGLSQEIYQNLMRLHEIGAGLSEYLVYAVELGDQKFQSCLMYDITRTGKGICLESTIESATHFSEIKKAGYEGYKKYLETGQFEK